MKKLSLFLVFLLLLQSCNVYNIPTSADRIVRTETKAKIITTNKKNYKFNRLEKENNRLIGITTLGSATAKKLAGMPAEINGNYLRIDLSGVEIEEIKLRNDSSSTLLTVAVIAGSLIVALVTIMFIGQNAVINDIKNIPVQ